MTTDRAATPSIDGGAGAAGLYSSERRLRPRTRRSRLDSHDSEAHVPEGDSYAGPGMRAQPAVESARAFGYVLCAVERTANGQAARDHANLLASPGGTVEVVPLAPLTRHGYDGLREACERHDLFALGAGRASYAAVRHVPIPVLTARWSPLGTRVTDAILVPVDGSRESTRAVELAGRLAATHGATVSILGAPGHDPAVERPIAASGRILLDATGAPPRRLTLQLPLDRAIASAAVAVSASLVVLGCGSSENARRTAAQIAGSVGCSVLTVPVFKPFS